MESVVSSRIRLPSPSLQAKDAYNKFYFRYPNGESRFRFRFRVYRAAGSTPKLGIWGNQEMAAIILMTAVEVVIMRPMIMTTVAMTMMKM